MRPDLSEISAFSILIKADWVHFDIPPDPILRYADKMRKLCKVCPLACHPHPMVEDDTDSNSKHKLCTLTVIKAGFLKLDQTDYSGDERTEVAQLIKDLDKLLQVKPVEASPVEPAPKLEPVVPVTAREKTLLEILTVCGVPVALFADGSVRAVEIGPFPFSSTGYRSLYPMPSAEDPIPPRDSVVKDLEGMVKDNAKELQQVEVAAGKRLKQKLIGSPVDDFIFLSAGISGLIDWAYFQEWDTSERLLKTALKLAKKCGGITIPDGFRHHAWHNDLLEERLAGISATIPILERCIDAQNLYELSVATQAAGNFHCSSSIYARLFEAKLPDMPPSADVFFYARLCAARHKAVAETEPAPYFAGPVRMSGLGRLELPAAPAPESSPVAPVPPAAYPLPASKPCYIFGWMSAGTDTQRPAQLYVERVGKDWGVSHDPADAYRFKSVDAILTYYRKIGHVHGDPEARIYDGSLMIFEHGPAGLRQIPRLTRQGSLFDNPPPFVEEQIDLLQGDDGSSTYSADELKILNAGFALVRYDRDNKTVQCTREDYLCGWAPPIPFITYAAAEKTLKGMLAADNVVEVLSGGNVNMTTSSKKLRTAGFEFYRSEGIIPGHGYPRIKIGSKNWGTWAKYETGAECQSAWDELMKDPKALVG